jgi:hypothetical protein
MLGISTFSGFFRSKLSAAKFKIHHNQQFSAQLLNFKSAAIAKTVELEKTEGNIC